VRGRKEAALAIRQYTFDTDTAPHRPAVQHPIELKSDQFDGRNPRGTPGAAQDQKHTPTSFLTAARSTPDLTGERL
jgi:hypothetical protein